MACVFKYLMLYVNSRSNYMAGVKKVVSDENMKKEPCCCRRRRRRRRVVLGSSSSSRTRSDEPPTTATATTAAATVASATTATSASRPSRPRARRPTGAGGGERIPLLNPSSASFPPLLLLPTLLLLLSSSLFGQGLCQVYGGGTYNKGEAGQELTSHYLLLTSSLSLYLLPPSNPRLCCLHQSPSVPAATLITLFFPRRR